MEFKTPRDLPPCSKLILSNHRAITALLEPKPEPEPEPEPKPEPAAFYKIYTFPGIRGNSFNAVQQALREELVLTKRTLVHVASPLPDFSGDYYGFVSKDAPAAVQVFLVSAGHRSPRNVTAMTAKRSMAKRHLVRIIANHELLQDKEVDLADGWIQC